MKHKIIVLSGVLLFILSSNKNPQINDTGVSEKGIHFFKGDLDDAMKSAKNENKLIFLEISTTWCGYCKQLKAHTYTDDEVGIYFNNNFINISIDAENDYGVKLKRKFSVYEYPTLIFLDREGNIILQTSGYRNAGRFLKLGKYVVNSL